MNKPVRFFAAVFLFVFTLPHPASAQKCRYTIDSTNPGMHQRFRSIQVVLDKQHTVVFRQDDKEYSLQLLIEVGVRPFGVVAKGDMLHVELEDGHRFDLFVSEKGKRTVSTVQLKCNTDRQTLELFAKSFLTGMKLHISSMDYTIGEPDDRRKSQLEKAAQCMLKD